MAIRQIASRILKKIYLLNERELVRKLMQKLGQCSVVGKEEVINFMQ